MGYFRIIFFFLLLISFSFGRGIINIDEIAQKEAKVEKKHIMIFFHMTHCPYCIRMIDNAFSDDIAKKKMEKDYIFIDVNVDDSDLIKYKDYKGDKRGFSKSLNISFYPTVVFIDNNNEIVYALKGYRDTSTFNLILDYITNNLYLNTDFAGYLTDLEFKD
jgi:thioredoxin-related protein